MNNRTISLKQGVAMYIGAVLGSGILILPGFTAQATGPSSILAWLLLSIVSVPLAYTFARLSLTYSHYGGMSNIVSHAFGKRTGAVTGWFFFVWVATGQCVVGFTGAGYLVNVFGLSNLWYYGIAFMFILLALLANLFGIRATGGFALLLSGIVLVLLIATIIFTLPAIEVIHFTPWFTHGWQGFGQASVLIFWALFGWESMTHLAPEFRNPKRDVMRSMWISVFLIGILYVLLSIVTVGTHTYSGTDAIAPLAVLMNHTLGISAAIATAVITCLVCLGTLNVYVASSARLGYAMARERQLPAWFNRLDRRGVPYRSAWFLLSTNTLVILLTYFYHWTVDQLILIPTSLGIGVYVLGTAACLKLLWHDRIGRMAALISFICCLAVFPFVATYIIIPIAVTIACLLFLRIHANEEK
jgi:amino acid efflux transporter